METIMRDIYKYHPKDISSFGDNPLNYTKNGEEIQKGLSKFKNYYFVPIQMKSSVKEVEDIIDWNFINRIQEIHSKGIFTKYPCLYTTFVNTWDGNKELFER